MQEASETGLNDADNYNGSKNPFEQEVDCLIFYFSNKG